MGRALRSRLVPTVLCAVALVAALGAAPAFAASAKSAAATATAPLAGGPIGVQIGPGQTDGATVIIVSVTLDPSVKLPARVQVPIPPGASIMWSGEILGGDPSADPQREPAIKQGDGAQYAEFTLSQSHQAQIDTSAQGFSVSGATHSGSVDFVQSVPGTQTTIAVRLPANVSAVQINPAPDGAPQTNSAGETLYGLPPMALSAGQKVTVAVSYSTAPASSGGSTQNPAFFVAFGVAVVAVLVVIAIMLGRRGPGGGDEDEGDDEVEAAPWRQSDQRSAGRGASAPDTRERDDAFDDDPFSTAD